MLTSFFRKSKPINYAVIGVMMLYYFISAKLSLSGIPFDFVHILKALGAFLVFSILVSTLNNLIQHHEITEHNSFTILLFVIFTGLFPTILDNLDMIVSGLLMVLAFKRAIGLRRKEHFRRKILDISFFLAVMVFSFESSFCFLAIPFFAVIIYSPQNIKHWLIPVIAMLSAGILAVGLSYFLTDSPWGLYNFNFALDYNFDTYRRDGLILPLGIILAFNIWLFFHFFKVTKMAKRRNKASLYLIFWFWVAAVFSVLFTPQKDGSELIFFILPVSIAGSLYLQQKKEILFKEILLIGMLTFSIVLPFLI